MSKCPARCLVLTRLDVSVCAAVGKENTRRGQEGGCPNQPPDKGSAGRGIGKGEALGDPSDVGVLKELRRLLSEKAELLASGLYKRDDIVIQQLDMRVQQLAQEQLNVP